MKPHKTTVLMLAAGILLFVSPGRAQEPGQLDVDSLVREIDQLFRARSSYAELEMEITTPHWSRTLRMKAWSEGTEKTFIRITAPAKERGVATLRIGNEMWNYLPKTNKVIKVPPSMMMNSWMGSDFTNDDLVHEFSLFEDYEYELIRSDSIPEGLIYINCIPHEDLPVVWGNIVVAARLADHIPLWQKYYDEKAELMRVMTYRDVQTMGGREIPAVLELVPQNEEGNKTVLRYKTAEFNIDPDEDVFSLRNLRSQN